MRKTLLSRLCNLHFKPLHLLSVNSKPLPTYPINTSFTLITPIPNPTVTPNTPYIQQKSQHLGPSHSLPRHLYYPHKPYPTFSTFHYASFHHSINTCSSYIFQTTIPQIMSHSIHYQEAPKVKQLSNHKSHPFHITILQLPFQRLRKPAALNLKPTSLRLLF